MILSVDLYQYHRQASEVDQLSGADFLQLRPADAPPKGLTTWLAGQIRAAIDDGRLNLYSLEFDRLWKLALIYPAFRSGRHGRWSQVRTAQCREVEILTRRPRGVNADGELTAETPARFRLLPRAVAVFVDGLPEQY